MLLLAQITELSCIQNAQTTTTPLSLLPTTTAFQSTSTAVPQSNTTTSSQLQRSTTSSLHSTCATNHNTSAGTQSTSAGPYNAFAVPRSTSAGPPHNQREIEIHPDIISFKHLPEIPYIIPKCYPRMQLLHYFTARLHFHMYFVCALF